MAPKFNQVSLLFIRLFLLITINQIDMNGDMKIMRLVISIVEIDRWFWGFLFVDVINDHDVIVVVIVIVIVIEIMFLS